MASERTPLIQVVPVTEPRDRYPHTKVSNASSVTKIKRICTIALMIFPFITLGIFFLVNPISGRHQIPNPKLAKHDVPPSWPQSEGLTYENLKILLQETPDAQKAREWSHYYTSGAHLAGKNLSQAEWTRDKWLEFGIHHAEIVEYEVYLNYPNSHELRVVENGKVKYEALLTEDVLEEDPTTGSPDSIPTFHGYSASGNVTAPFIFCNQGTAQDFDDLEAARYSLEGKIAIVKYGGDIFRSLKVKNAQERGMVGVVMYSDPGDDGKFTVGNGYLAYPDGPARHPSSVQRGSVMYLWNGVGDPTTPGYPSKPGVPRQSVKNAIPSIPSLPISYRDAIPLLRALDYHGISAQYFKDSWAGGLGYEGVHYYMGPSPDHLVLNLVNKQDYVTTPIWNAIGVINGTLEDEVIVIGNHRDAWVVGGAGDPNSGSAILNEVVRAFGKAVKAGWKPQRTIVFASWDGEEYGLLGSTEWVEEYLPWLSASAVAYINLDVGVSGPNLLVGATPNLDHTIAKILAQVQSPDRTKHGFIQTVNDNWNKKVERLGSGSDFTAFLDHAGVSSIHVGFETGANDPIYHYHSNYDSLHWMDKFGDPGFKYHVTLAQVAVLLAAELVEQPIIPLNATHYVATLRHYLDDLHDRAQAQRFGAQTGMDAHWMANIHDHVKSLIRSLERLGNTTAHFDFAVANLTRVLRDDPDPATLPELFGQARDINLRLKTLERQFLSEDGLVGRKWFKHQIYAPDRKNGYAPLILPAFEEAWGERHLVRKAVETLHQRFAAAQSLLSLHKECKIGDCPPGSVLE